ncbi:MAG: hypothetical protein U1E87_00225 [Alphaproteobacteria bacterium]
MSGGEQSLLGLLTARGLLTSAQVRDVEDRARAWRSGLAEALLALGYVDPDRLAQAMAEAAGLQVLDARSSPLDPDFAEPEDVPFLVRHRVLPWRRAGGRALIAVVNPFTAQPVLDHELGKEPYEMRVMTQRDPRCALASAQAERQVRAAVDNLGRRHPMFSARSGLAFAQISVLALLAGGIALGFREAPATSLDAVALAAGVFYVASMAFRLFLMLASLWPLGRRRRGVGGASAGDLPHYSVLVALHDEADVVRATPRRRSAASTIHGQSSTSSSSSRRPIIARVRPAKPFISTAASRRSSFPTAGARAPSPRPAISAWPSPAATMSCSTTPRTGPSRTSCWSRFRNLRQCLGMSPACRRA